MIDTTTQSSLTDVRCGSKRGLVTPPKEKPTSRSRIDARRESLRRLNDGRLLHQVEHLRERERRTLIDVLLHLNEVYRRKLHLREGYGSMFRYCTDALEYSKSAACRRIQAARCLGRFPTLDRWIENGEIRVSHLCLIEPVLSPENLDSMIHAIRGRTQAEVEQIVARHRPPVAGRERVQPVSIRTASRRAGSPSDSDGAASDKDPSDTPVSDTDASDRGASDRGLSDTGLSDTGLSDTAVSGTAASDSAPSDTAVSDTAVSDTAVSDTAGTAVNTTSSASRQHAVSVAAATVATIDPVDPVDEVDATRDIVTSDTVGRSPEHAASSASASDSLGFRVSLVLSPKQMEKLKRVVQLVAPGRRCQGTMAHALEKAMDLFIKQNCPLNRDARRIAKATQQTSMRDQAEDHNIASAPAEAALAKRSQAAPERQCDDRDGTPTEADRKRKGEPSPTTTVDTQSQGDARMKDKTAAERQSQRVPRPQDMTAVEATRRGDCEPTDGSVVGLPSERDKEWHDTSEVDTEPIDHKAIVSEGVCSEPVERQAIGSEGARSEPVGTEPGGGEGARSEPVDTEPGGPVGSTPRARGSIDPLPIRLRDRILARDGGRCTFVGPGGRRCGATRRLEVDHIIPRGKGGQTTADNLRTLCHAHNQFEADKAYGREFMEQHRHPTERRQE